jgi:hypothetical protein
MSGSVRAMLPEAMQAYLACAGRHGSERMKAEAISLRL